VSIASLKNKASDAVPPLDAGLETWISLMNRLLLPLLATTFIVLAPLCLLHAAGEKPGPVAYVTIETRDLTIEFAGDRAWTISRILHHGKVITNRTGFYGTVFSPEGGKWIGTGHNDGGIEKVESAVLTVDGKECPLEDRAVYRGKRAELHKRSMLGPIRLEATYTITDDLVLERHRYDFTEEVKIGTLYAFMHPFLPATTEWIAEGADGAPMEGVFESKGDHALRSDVKWTAIYDPVAQQVSLAWYPVPLVGQALKTFYWDKTVYHKLYNQIFSHADVAKGTKIETNVIVTCAEADAASWKEKARSLVADLQKRQEKGETALEAKAP
jgi:hypothetical protein